MKKKFSYYDEEIECEELKVVTLLDSRFILKEPLYVKYEDPKNPIITIVGTESYCFDSEVSLRTKLNLDRPNDMALELLMFLKRHDLIDTGEEIFGFYRPEV